MFTLKKLWLVFLTSQVNRDFSNIPIDQMSAGLQKHSEALVNNLTDAEGRTEFTSLITFLSVKLF